MTFIVVAVAVIAYAWPFWTYLNFHPLNGAFQTFNPTRRLLAGELPGGGFQPYLGVGVSAFHAAITLVLGGDFAANQFMARLIPPFVVLGYVAIVMYLAKFRLDVALLLFWMMFLIVIASLLRIGLQPYGLTLPDVFHELIEPGTSTLTSRMLLPLLTVIAIIVVERWQRDRSANGPILRAVLFGTLTGLQPFWSNDYGAAGFACLTAVYWLSVGRSTPPTRAMLGIWSVSFFAAFGAALLFAGGLDWLRYNFQGVVRTQFWYFGFAGENPPPAYRITDVPVPGWVWVYGFGCAWMFWRAIRSPRAISGALLCYVATTPFLAGMIATIGGHAAERYFLPLRILLPFVLGATAIDVVTAWTGDNRDRAVSEPSRDADKSLRSQTVIVAPPFLLMIASVVLWWPQFSDAFRSHFNPPGDYFLEPALGGRVQEFYSGLIGLAHEIATETRNLPPRERVTSTYASALDVVAGSRNAPGQDYVIHAMGDRARSDFLEAFKSARPHYATAISDHFTTWGEWQWYANWWFFRELLLTYRPKYETSTHIIFETRRSPLEPEPVPCKVTVESSQSAVVMTQPLERQPAAPLMIEVSLTYSVKRSAGEPAGLLSAFRYFVDVEQLGGSEAPPRNFGAPPVAVDWPILVKDFNGRGASARITVTPALAWELVVSGCKARMFGSANDLQRGRYFVTTAANVSDLNWERGIAKTTEPSTGLRRAGLVVRDGRELSKLASGDEILLASGSRSVVRVDGNQLWLNGAPLDPAIDGFPVTVKFPQRNVLSTNPTIVAAQLTDANWEDGVWRAGGSNAQYSFFFLTNTFPLGLSPGDELEFALAGRRTVLHVSQNGQFTNVLVSGAAALSAVGDGYPNPIRIVHQAGSPK